ncbi:MAG: MBL fold metallo-hydrolase [Myxococcaceae bacterium]
MRRFKRLAKYFAVFVVSLVAAIAIAGCALSAPRYGGPSSDHFDGKKFHNLEDTKDHTNTGDFLRWQLTRNPGPWRGFEEKTPGPKPPDRVGEGQLRVTFINHATTLIQLEGLNVLTDPIWSDRCSPFSFAGPSRRVPPGIRFEDLPPIDVVLVSHNHYDHMDVPTLRKLVEKFHPKIFVGLGNTAFLSGKDITGSTDLDWWQSVELSPSVRLHSVPMQHFSNRGLVDSDANLWTGFLLQTKAGNVLFAGDTGFGPHWKLIREKFGQPRLAVLPIGAFRPEWFMSRIHMSPEQAVQAHEILGAHTSVAIHFGTFQLADDGQDEAPMRLRNAVEKASGTKPDFRILGFGEGLDVSAIE